MTGATSVLWHWRPLLPAILYWRTLINVQPPRQRRRRRRRRRARASACRRWRRRQPAARARRAVLCGVQPGLLSPVPQPHHQQGWLVQRVSVAVGLPLDGSTSTPHRRSWPSSRRRRRHTRSMARTCCWPTPRRTSRSSLCRPASCTSCPWQPRSARRSRPFTTSCPAPSTPSSSATATRFVLADLARTWC